MIGGSAAETSRLKTSEVGKRANPGAARVPEIPGRFRKYLNASLLEVPDNLGDCGSFEGFGAVCNDGGA